VTVRPVARRLASIASLALVASALLTPGIRAAEPQSLVIMQDPPQLTFVDRGDDGWGPGDLFTFRAAVVTQDGRAGTVAGDHQTVAMPVDGPVQEHRAGIAVFDLGGGDTILFGGQTSVAVSHEMMSPGLLLARSILGGTGAYEGAHGEIDSIRAEDGSWTHTLTYELTDPAAPTTEIVVDAMVEPARAIALAGGDGLQRGDAISWDLAATTTDGEPVMLSGLHYRTLADGEDGAGSEVVGMAVLQDANGDLLFAAGRNPIGPSGDPYPLAGVAIRRPIIGGTGRFAGARGEQTVLNKGGGEVVYTSRVIEPVGEPDETIVLRHDPVVPRLLPMRASGANPGDRYTWEATADGEENMPPSIRGYLMAIDMADTTDPSNVLMGVATVTLPDGSTILLADARRIDPAVGLVDGPMRRAIVGGTGRYAGVSGEMVTTLDDDGRITETLSIRR
jgi:hypothetical protein